MPKIQQRIQILKHLWKHAIGLYSRHLRDERLKNQGREIVLQEGVKIIGDIENLKLSNKVHLNKNVYLNLGGKSYGGNGSISIGQNTIVSDATTLYAGGGEIQIGSNCDIGVGVLVLAHNSYAPLHIKTWEEKTIQHHSINMGNFVQIGSGAIILGPCTIGDYAIIGSGTVVTGNIPEKSVISPKVGFPVDRV